MRRRLLFFSAILITYLVFSPLVTIFVYEQTAYGAATSVDDQPTTQLERWFYYRGMRACLSRGFALDTISNTDLDQGKIPIPSSGGGINLLSENKKGFGYIAQSLDGGDDKDGTVKCNTDSIWKNGASTFGFGSVSELICEVDSNLDTSVKNAIEPNGGAGADCLKSTKFAFYNSVNNSAVQSALTKALEKNGKRPPFDINDNNGSKYDYKALLYLIGKQSLETFCGGGVSLSDGIDNAHVNDENRVKVDIVSNGNIQKDQTYKLKGRIESNKVDDVYYNHGGDENNAQDLTCSEMAKMTRDYSSAYQNYQRADPTGSQQAEQNMQNNANQSPGDDTTSCAIDGVGWIVCPIINFMGDLNDQAFSAISGFLTVDPSLLGDGTKTAWSQFRDIANVAFVIAFLIIIYSQVSGAGVSNYGIKKLLPKIIIAAILVNASFLICQIAVDLSNILGSSIYGFMKGIPTTAGDAATGLPAWKEVSGKVLALGAAALLAVLLLTVFSTAALLAVAMTVLILIARKSLLILLIVISPIAFVAYLLPNTEDLFKKWMKIFRDLLMVFPVVGLIFGASTLAARIINGSSTDILIQLTALGVMAVPLFAVPVVLKGALAATGTLGAKLSGWQDKANAGALNAAKNGRLGEAWSAHQARRQENKVNRRMGNGRIARLGKSKYLEGTRAGKALVWTGSRGAAFDRTRPGKILGGDRGAAAAVASYHKAVGEEVDRRQTLLSDKSGDELVGMLEKGGMSAEEEAAVHRQIAKVGGDKHVQKSIDHIMRSRDSGGDHARDVQQLSAEALLKRKPSGLGSEDANKLINGSLGENTGGTTGYKDLLQDRVQKGKLGAKDYAAMSKDDLIRLGELSRASKLSDDDILKMNAEFTAIEKDETLKGTLTDERRALYKSILDGGGPKGADGSDYSIRGPTAL